VPGRELNTLHVEATMKTTSVLIATLLTVGAGMSAGTAIAGNGIVASATGSGQITVGTDLRTFSFTARTDSNNNSSGQAELFNRNSGIRFHITLNCLSVVGTVATMSGTVAQDNASGAYVGDPVWFQVVDNGEGAGAPPDLISLVYYFVGAPGVPCTSPLAPATIPIQSGNIQVH
jgi:hypothetical protein